MNRQLTWGELAMLAGLVLPWFAFFIFWCQFTKADAVSQERYQATGRAIQRDVAREHAKITDELVSATGTP